MNILDRAIGFVNPRAGYRRARARYGMEVLNSGYGNYGASLTKKSTKGWLYGGGSAKEDIDDHAETLRQRSRDLYAGAPIATSAIKTYGTNVVGTGLVLKSHIDYKFLGLTTEQARQLETEIEREWNLYASGPECDLERVSNFYQLQYLAFTNMLMSGDVVTLLPTTKRPHVPYDLRVQLVEADRLCNPDLDTNDNITGGVETNAQGEVVAYHICKRHPLSTDTTKEDWVKVEAYGAETGRRNVLHLLTRERIGQRRGVPLLAPVIEALKQLSRYTDAELVAAVVNGLFAIFIEKDGNSNEAAFGSAVPENEQVDAMDPNSIELAPGSVVDLGDGEKANAVTPGRPNSNFDGFVTAIIRQIGGALEIPKELLVKEFTNNYSSSRAALLEFWKAVKKYRAWLVSDFCQPVFEEWLTEAVAKGRVGAPGFFTNPTVRKAYSRAKWHGPAQGLLNPVQEVTAAEKRVQNGFATAEHETAEMNGTDFMQNAAQRQLETKMMKGADGDA